jgi:hypothetical protein
MHGSEGGEGFTLPDPYHLAKLQTQHQFLPGAYIKKIPWC